MSFHHSYEPGGDVTQFPRKAQVVTENGRVRVILGLVAAVMLSRAQTVVDEAKIPRNLRTFEREAGEAALKCSAVAIPPHVDYGFRFQSGYMIRLPLEQYSGAGHRLVILARVTPLDGGSGARPVYLLGSLRLPAIPKTKFVAEVGGAYLLGEGRYRVELRMQDDQQRVCRATLRVSAQRGRAERNMTLRIPENAVWAISSRHTAAAPVVEGEKPYRITVMVHVAPLFARSTRLRAWDKEMVLGTLGPLLEQLPAQSVRLVMFNLDQQKTLFTQDQFRLEDIDQVVQVLNGVELGTVNVGVLKNRAGHVGLLTELLKREVEAQSPPDAVVFLGPIARAIDRFPAGELGLKGGGDDARFYYIQYRPPVERGAFTDLIENAVRSLKGKVFHVHNPGEFANAIRQMSRF